MTSSYASTNEQQDENRLEEGIKNFEKPNRSTNCGGPWTDGPQIPNKQEARTNNIRDLWKLGLVVSSSSKAHVLLPAPQKRMCRSQLLKSACVTPSSSKAHVSRPAPQKRMCHSQLLKSACVTPSSSQGSPNELESKFLLLLCTL